MLKVYLLYYLHYISFPATGPAELMLKKLLLGGNQYVLSSEEKKAIEEMYRNPCFTVSNSTMSMHEH